MRARTIVALDEWLTQAAHRRPDHPALVAEGRTVSYAELDAAAARTARQLAAAGVREGERVATTLAPGHAFCELLHALPRLGAILVPLDPRDSPALPCRVVSVPPAGAEADVALRAEVDPEAVHCVIHTSGTTGRPKPVELTYANQQASALACADALGVDRGDRWLCPLPPYHVGGLAVLIRCAISATTAVVHERYETERVKASLESGAVSLASLVPTMLVRLREAGLRQAPGLRTIALGGGPVWPGLLAWAVEAGIPVTPVYGMTETCSQVVAGIPGRPLRGVELRTTSEGEILVRGPMVARAAVSNDGWLHTGDRGRLDELGLHLEGRLKEIIVSGGENLSPVEIEDTLLSHPAVGDAAVVGLPDAEWGEAVSAFVVLREEVATSELRDWCRERLAPQKVPKRIEIVQRLPRNRAGKLLRGRL